jgi:4-hydroxy-4-methyl-2-oxoglutarate aldolase
MATSDAGRDRDLAILERLGGLYVAVVADCLDRVGVRGNVMAPHIRPLYPEATVAGYALTVHVVDVPGIPEDRDRWYRGELGAVDAQQPGDVMVVSTSDGSYWGELLATASRFRGARGLVADAYTRDTAALIEMRYPTFVAGVLAYDSLGRIDVDAVDVPIECGGVTVNPGDLVLGDCDGVVVVPHEAAEEVIARAEEKVSSENLVRGKLSEGMPMLEAFQTYGVI